MSEGLRASAEAWWFGPQDDARDLVDAACDALISGSESDAIASLAALPHRAHRDDVAPVLEAIAAETGWPWPPGPPLRPAPRPTVSPSQRPERPAAHISTFRLVTIPGADAAGAHLRFNIGDGALTLDCAGSGMESTINHLALLRENGPAVISWCEDCWCAGCDDAIVRVTREGDVVWWDFVRRAGTAGVYAFHAAHYDAELARYVRESDHVGVANLPAQQDIDPA